jgi:3,4-dihydroxy 2-butanone 4-phosphate synthase/GTP cyclohydrolase II
VREKLVDRIGEFTVDTEIGPLKGYAYMTHFDQVHHMAVVYGRIGDGRNVPTRLHRANLIRDVFGGNSSVPKVLRHFKREGQGVFVFLRDGSVGVPVSAIPKSGDKNGEKGDAGSEAERQRQWREIGLGAQILKDLGIASIRLITAAKHRYVGLAGFGIEIVSTEPIAE